MGNVRLTEKKAKLKRISCLINMFDKKCDLLNSQFWKMYGKTNYKSKSVIAGIACLAISVKHLKIFLHAY